uniref:Genome polyprotein n=1 Tax=Wuhan carp picornavirus TaxID=2116199 RepID=A0A2P1GN88_9VIRU|nr:polyprotein [Wuhan carp picornavirus]
MDALLCYPEMILMLFGGALIAFPLLGDSLSAGIRCHSINKPVETHMDTIKSIVSGASKVTNLLGAAGTEAAENASDRVGAVASTNASLLSQATTRTKYGFYPSKDCKDHFFSQAMKTGMSETNKQKMIELASADWIDANVEGTILATIKLPEAFYSAKEKPAHGPTRPFGSIRTNFTIEVQANVSTGSIGSLGVVYVPPGVQMLGPDVTRNLRTWRLHPSDELNIGVNTSAKLYIPYTHYQNYVDTDSDQLGQVVVFVWARLTSAPGTTASGIAIFGAMDQTDLQKPRPQAPERVRIREGPGSMNLANCKETCQAESLALAGEAVAVDPTTSGSSRAIRNLKHILQVYAATGNDQTNLNFTTAWEASAIRGTSLASYAVSGTNLSGISNIFSNAFRFWRGIVVFRVTVFNSTLHKGRLKVAFYPGDVAAYTAENSQNAIYSILDIGLNPSIELVVPYMNNTWLKDTGDFFGRLTVFVSSRLSAANNAAPRVRFIVEARYGDDVEFLVPYDRGLNFQMRDNGDETDYTGWGTNTDVQVTDSVVDAGTTAAASETGLAAPSQEVNKPGEGDPIKNPISLAAITKKVRIARADHLSTSILFGRASYAGRYTHSSSSIIATAVPEPSSGVASLLKLFAYFNCDLTLHIHNQSTGVLACAHSYVNDLQATTQNMATMGTIMIPPNENGSFTVPFYNITPARLLAGDHPFGYLYMYSFASSVIDLWISFKTISLFQPIAVPRWTTVRAFLTRNREAEWEHPQQDVIDNLVRLKMWDATVNSCPRRALRARITGPNTMGYAAMKEDEAGGWKEDLTEDGDVESNPGPFKNMMIPPEKPIGDVIQAVVGSEVPANTQTISIKILMDRLGRAHVQINCLEQAIPETTWRRDLTQSGDVESNPGPSRSLVIPPTMTIGEIIAAVLGPNDTSAETQTLSIKILIDRLGRSHVQIFGFPGAIPASVWVHDLTTDGDVESNPGPTCELVYIQRGLYKHYGVKYGQKVFHMGSENILGAAMMGKVRIECSDHGPQWITERSVDITQLRLHSIEKSAGMISYFSASNNCETYAYEALGITGFTQARALCVIGLIILGATAISALPEGESEQTVFKQFTTKMKNTGQKCWSKVSTFFSETMFDAIKCDVTKTIFKLVLRTVCYGILFCSCPNLLTAAAVGSLVAMDIASIEGLSHTVKDLCSALLDGDLVKCVEAMSDLIHENREDRQTLVRDCVRELRMIMKDVGETDVLHAKPEGPNDPFRLFNSGTSAAKNVEWWISLLSRFLTWIKSFFCENKTDMAIKYLKENDEIVMQIMCDADTLLVEGREGKNLRRKDFQEDVDHTLQKLTKLKFICLTAHAMDVVGQINLLLGKLQRMPKPVANDGAIFRMEPIGVWVSGDPGCGKSSFTYTLLTELRAWLKERTKIPDSGVYTTAAGSDHMDGYEGQWMHVIDDMAQNKEEEDVKFLCQMISSVPWTTPQADLPSKGTQYSSQIVIATTNRTNFESCVLYDSSALRRRFPFTFTLKPAANFRNDDGKLDITKATESGAAKNGAAWDIAKGVPGTDFRVGNMKQIVHSIGCAYLERLKVSTLLTKQYEPLKGVTGMRQMTVDWAEIMDEIKKKKPEITPLKQAKPEGNFDAEEFCEWVEATDIEAKCREVVETGVLSEEMKERLEQSMAYLMSTSYDTPFESLIETPRTRIGKISDRLKKWWGTRMEKIGIWWTKYKPFFIAAGILGSVISTCVGIYMLVKTFSHDPIKEFFNPLPAGDPERAYNGPTMNTAKANKTQRIKIHPDGPNPAEYSHLYKAAAALQIGGKNCYAIVVKPHTVMTYKHYWFRCGGKIEALHWNGLKHCPEPCTVHVTDVQLENDDGAEIVSDYIFVTFERCPFQMKTIQKFHSPPEWGREGVALMAHPAGNYSQHVDDIQASGAYVVGFDDGDQVCSDSVIYRTKSFAGMCGAMICQKVQGAWKVVAMHHAGNRHTFGFGCRIRIPELPDGVVTEKIPAAKPHYTPTKSKLEKSPLFGIVAPEMQPAPLSAKDKRLEVEVDNLVKFASDKYRVNVYEPDKTLMNAVAMYTAKQIFAATGRCGMWTLEEALEGGIGNPIDMRTSPGEKYVKLNMRKKDLFKRNNDGTWWVFPGFREDVEEQLRLAGAGEAHTVFAATLKDELRANEKVRQGKSRCIEACNVDFTVAHRMIYGPLYEKIYSSTPLQTGLAVGCNPYTDFHGIASAMKEHWFAIDYSRFDGSLSKELMQQAAEILVACTENCELARNILKPVIDSTHLVADEVWMVSGGMPSGSPCTTVLNSLCNLLVVRYAMATVGFSFEEVILTTYGDDVIGSATQRVSAESVVRTIKDVFGMEATSADKKSLDLTVHPNEATFLKRRFRHFPGTRFVTGQLDLDSMLQKIQWCHGLEEFKQQFESFTQELVLHGEETYAKVTQACAPILDKYRILIPTYAQRYVEVYDMLFN